MSGRFYGSNVLLYLASGQQDRISRVRELVRGGGTISVQVLNEIAAVSRRKFKMSWEEAAALISEAEELLTVEPLTLPVHKDGLRLAERYGFSIYDSFIVAAALAAECDTLWSEDMQHGMLVDDRLRIANPFAP